MEAGKLLRSSAIISVMTLLSRILGLVRDMVIAATFGSGSTTDAFFVAFRIPNLFRRMVAEGAFSLAFVPIFNEYKEQRSRAELQALLDRVTGSLGVVLLLLTTLGMLAAPWFVRAFALGFGEVEGKLALTAGLLQITFPYLLFISLTALAAGIFNSFGRFAIPAFTPVLLNLSMIGAALLLAPFFSEPITALAWGVFIAGLIQLSFQLPFLLRLGLLPRPRLGFRDPGVRRIMRLMGPVLLGSSAAQINLLINTQLAALLVSGSVSWLYYSDRLLEFPVGLFGVALGTVILPRLSQEHANQSLLQFRQTLDWALRWALLIALPAAAALAVLAGPLLATLFRYGEFGDRDVIMASRSVMALAPGVVGFLAIKVLAPGFFARQDSKTPMKIAVTSVVANICLSLLLLRPLAHAGLALATALAALLNAGLLLWMLHRHDIYRPEARWLKFLLRLLLATAVMAIALDWLAGNLSIWLVMNWHERLLGLTGLVLAGLVVYSLVLLLGGMRPRDLHLNI